MGSVLGLKSNEHVDDLGCYLCLYDFSSYRAWALLSL